ncbi:phosphoribosylamine--glycine ligase [Salinirubellus salinus]|jgi:phosphoribosylamine--glycine ligase|uniref:Phosphoribosylamine--glycine ligase n=1 Tax=Salinirubellus salinus TaxID=1364945 RepID=A0A9E7R5V8_9EURY|nr:phosphoribosylamine--glycine ligase [Salinirubellus salinus]UWM55779.1 phosphoribosylamine--glycine ligase [Salinirubellus salinus]
MSETVLLVGGGGREHAIAHAVADSADATLYACASNTNPGIRRLAAGYENVDETDPEAIVAYAESVDASLAVIGPESALQAGVADALDEAGVYAFGPQSEEARIETDKQFQREFMEAEDIPGCPGFEAFESADDAAAYIESIDHDVAVKPRGLTGGKGVRVTGDQVTHEEAIEYVRESGHEEWVVEERLVGEEFTVQAFVANGSVRVSPAVQDHKRAYEGDEGPNTGGMGSYSDARFELPFMSGEEYDAAVEVVEATVEALDGYKGILYGQFMLTSEGPKVVEFNARFGDPEAMNTLPVLESDFVSLLSAARDGEPLPELTFAAQATVCKYAVPEGYPTDPVAGAEVKIDEAGAEAVGARLFYASVDAREDGIFTTTSRSFAVVGVADSIREAEELAEAALAEAGEEGLRVRHDIGTADLLQRRVDHMRELRSD